MSFNMSSDEEFYDAEEQTPNRTRSESCASGQISAQGLPSLEEEERRLLELKLHAEERRRKEDEELKMKLMELEQRKKQEEERLEAEQRAHEGELRRRRLEEMRRKLAEDNNSPPKKPPRLHAQKPSHATASPVVDTIHEISATEKETTENTNLSTEKINEPPSIEQNAVDITADSSNQSECPAEHKDHVIGQDDQERSDFSSSVDTESSDQTVIEVKPPSENRKLDIADNSSETQSPNNVQNQPSIPTVDTTTSQPSMSSVQSSSKSNVQNKIEISFKYDNETESVIAEVTENLKNSTVEYITDSNVNVCVNAAVPDEGSNTIYHRQHLERGDGDMLKEEQNGRTSIASMSPEPDIIQMTKTASDGSLNHVKAPHEDITQPVAPPRRKKKSKAPPPPSAVSVASSLAHNDCDGKSSSPEKDRLSDPESSSQRSAEGHITSSPSPEKSLNSDKGGPIHPVVLHPVSLSVDEGDPIGLPPSDPEMLSPTSTVFNLTKDLEKSLDIQSATSGDRHVTASEDEDYKVGSAESTSPVNSKNATPENTIQRPRSGSGRVLTDEEILQAVAVLNLDTGETVPLNMAEEKLPRCINPLSLHIMRLTQEYSSASSLQTHKSDDEDGVSISQKQDEDTQTVCEVKMPRRKRKGIKIKKFLGKTMNKIKSVADEVLHGEDSSSESDDSAEGRRMIKIKASSAHKGPYDFDLLVPVQDLSGAHAGAVWTMKFSHCGRLLATGGQDNILRVWVLKEAFAYFDDMRQKYSEAARVSPSPSQESINSMNEASDTTSDHGDGDETQAVGGDDEDDEHAPFRRRPFCVYRSHTAAILDLSWSKNYFLLSSSMDKTVRLWHVSRKECLCCFQHIDFVTAIAFHPRDDRYFLSGSLDGKLRLWNIPDKKVALWNEVTGSSKLITAANFCMNGRFAVVGTYDGRCIFYSTEQLKYYTQIHVRSTRGKNSRGRKISGIEPMPGEDKVLVTSNDSRVRLYDLRDLTLTCKYKGYANNSSQIKASFNHNGKYLISGSEDHFVYIWHTQHEFHKLSSARRDRNDFWEGIKAHNAVVTSAIFTPNPGLLIKPQFEFVDSEKKEAPVSRGEVFISADFQGCIKVFLNKFKPGSGYM